jgi:di/tricarboxylate transporter
MTFSIGLLLLIIAAALVHFSFERISAEITALAVLLTLVLAGLLPTGEGFAGFGSEAVIMILGLFILTASLVRTAAAAVIPVAVQAAFQMDLNPRTFVMMIAAAASFSYLAQLEPACLMVYGPGRYRFTDFLKVDALLTVLIYLLAILQVPRIWPL